jgi:hypothetical protein
MLGRGREGGGVNGWCFDGLLLMSIKGNAFGLDRQALAESLGFSSPSTNSLDSVCDRDHVAELIFWASMTMTHLSQVLAYLHPCVPFIAHRSPRSIH